MNTTEPYCVMTFQLRGHRYTCQVQVSTRAEAMPPHPVHRVAFNTMSGTEVSMWPQDAVLLAQALLCVARAAQEMNDVDLAEQGEDLPPSGGS